jgi:hypothetical protein
MECIPFCSKLLRKDDAKIVSGDDGACFPAHPNHPTYPVVTLRCLLIAHLYLFKWVKWDTHVITHGSLVTAVVGSVGRSPTGFPMVMEVGEFCSGILLYLPELSGDRIHNQVHSSFVDRALSSVLLFFLITLLQVTKHLHGPTDEGSSYFGSRKIVPADDGLSEKSVVLILMRIFISHTTRLWMISPGNWLNQASVALKYLRENFPVLVGGFAGAWMGEFEYLLTVFAHF